MKQAESDYIIQIDGDIILHPNFIEDHVKTCTGEKFCAGLPRHPG